MLACCCRHLDPGMCLFIRHGQTSRQIESEEGCECECHHEDIDGWSPWDDELDPAGEPEE